MWFCQMAIPANAEHVEEAHTFINYIMRPQIIARASNYLNYANGNLASQELLDERVRGDKSIYPDAQMIARLFVKTSYDAKTQRIVTRAWTKFVTGR